MLQSHRLTTISPWLKRLTKLSTTQTPVPSVRSVASDLVLARGVPLDEVVTMRNWSSAAVLTHTIDVKRFNHLHNKIIYFVYDHSKAVR